MAQIAIMVGVSVGLAVVSSLLQPGVPKQAPIDRGKQDDLRFTIVEEGAFIPRTYGNWVRLGGNIFWGTPTQEHRQTTAGSSGGKKGRGAEPATNNFSYDKSFAAYCCEGPIRSFLRIKEGDNVLFDHLSGQSAYYEAEREENTLAGGATIIEDATLLSGLKVRLPPGASVSFPGVASNTTGAFDLGIYFQAGDLTPFTVRVDGTTDYTDDFPDSSSALAVFDQEISLASAGSHTIKLTNDHLTEYVDIDRIFLFATLPEDAPEPNQPKRTTGVVADITYPTDLDDPSAFYNAAARVDADGHMTVTSAAGGQALLEFYLGTDTQPQSPTIVTAEGAANTPAHRGLASIVAKDYQVQNGQLQNLTFEVEPLLNDLADACIAEYKLRGALDSELNFEALRGTILDGLYIDRLAPLSETMEALKIFFNFNIVPVDGKITAVPRGGASCRTIPNHELLAYEEGGERPKGVRIEHIEATDLPGGVYVAWVSPAESKDFHNATQFVPLGFGPSLEAETLNFPLVVPNPDDAVAAGKRYLFTRHLQKDPLSFSLSPKHRDLIPTDVVTLQLPQQTIDVELQSTQAALPGLVKAKALPEDAGIYNQVGIGEIGSGTETRRVRYPSNALLYFADLPPLRDEEGLFYYLSLCPRGSGHYEGGYAYEETVPDTDEFTRVDSFPHAATIGVLVDDLPAVTNLEDLDTDNEITLDLYFDEGLFESRPEADVRARDVNILILGSGEFANVLKFTTATYETADAPYARRVVLSGLLHGLKGTQSGAAAGTSSGTIGALLTDAIHAIPDLANKLNLERKFAGVSVGQALPDAPTVLRTNTGRSLAPIHPIESFLCFFDAQSGNALFEWQGTAAQGASNQEAYQLEIRNSADTATLRPLLVTPALNAQLSDTLSWEIIDDSHSVLTLLENGGIDVDAGVSTYSELESVSTAGTGGGLLIEFEVASERVPLTVLLHPTDEAASVSDPFCLSWTILFEEPSTYWVVPELQYSLQYTMSVGDRYSIYIRPDGIVEYHLNYLGQSSHPLFVSAKPIKPGLYKVTALSSNLSEGPLLMQGVRRARWARRGPEFSYNVDSQEADYGSLPATIKARVRQKSFFPDGPPGPWVNGVFTR